jgi:hypothetical protein
MFAYGSHERATDGATDAGAKVWLPRWVATERGDDHGCSELVEV